MTARFLSLAPGTSFSSRLSMLADMGKRWRRTLADFVIIGFPKCGTSALARAIGTLQDVQVDRYIGGELEAPYFSGEHRLAALRSLRKKAPSATAVGHKFTGYVYDNAALRRIAAAAPRSTLVVCVRDPKGALVSWREMHRRIAAQGTNMAHFVNHSEDSRRFYIEASLEDYYRYFARERLMYAAHLERMRNHVPRQALVVVSQEYMAARMDRVLHVLAERLRVPAPSERLSSKTHRSIAQAMDADGLNDDSRAELAAEKAMLNALLDRWRRLPNVTVLADGDADGTG